MATGLRIIAIDWSGAQRAAARKIWLAEAARGDLCRLENGRDRDEMAEHLLREAEVTPQLVIGLDFAFSLPAWFLEARGLRSVYELWDLVEREGEAWLAACRPPFWGRRGCPRPPIPAHFRRTEESAPIRPKSVFQVGGAGAVGTGSLRGMPLLRRLHGAGFSIWPFGAQGWPRVIEIYPRLLTGPVNKSRRTARATYLTRRFPSLGPRLRARGASGDDAFDAAVSALTMAGHVDDLLSLAPGGDPQITLEGAIWVPRGPC